MSTRTVISAWSAVSPYGLDRTDFAAGVRDRRATVAPLDRDAWPAPVGSACLIPGFDARSALGKKGTRSMDRLTALAVATAGRLLAGPDGARLDGVGPDTGVVLGTSGGSTQSMMDFMRDSLVQERPYYVDPARFPNTVMNTPAAQCAIWHELRGPNATVAAGRASGLLALNYARRLHRSGRARAVVCGAAEEFSVARARLEQRRGASAVLGEGCAMLLVEPAGVPGGYRRRELAELLALEFGVWSTPADVPTVLARCVRRALAGAGESPAGVWAVASAGGDLDRPILRDDPPVRLSGTELVGDTNGAAAAFAVAALLSVAAEDPAASGRTALVTAVDRDGVVGCALLRLGAGE